MQKLTNESNERTKTQKINQQETRNCSKVGSLDFPPQAMKKSEMQKLTNESKKTQKIDH